MGRPILIFRDKAWPFTLEDAELLRDNLRLPEEELLKEKFERAISTTDCLTIQPSEYRGVLAAIHATRQSGVDISDDMEKLQAELDGEIDGGPERAGSS